ncbi:hypothetical protein BCR37DRAFT_386998 [Protomyces lactucae-debilis]|uniref:Uncharacterized protein n=1 Tax=Protomyces lactucae-debilis TaxID=2754530 RepID=A0A1Y2FHP2_PROLT|nr:uncharacterized protein BCR37DRAFT_386998 [Protomyces lactucae-debilis]ORY83127.1 hypothetical protein BCR37DRAFT_386998 [Protomyces lactucae-debilis]
MTILGIPAKHARAAHASMPVFTYSANPLWVIVLRILSGHCICWTARFLGVQMGCIFPFPQALEGIELHLQHLAKTCGLDSRRQLIEDVNRACGQSEHKNLEQATTIQQCKWMVDLFMVAITTNDYNFKDFSERLKVSARFF